MIAVGVDVGKANLDVSIYGESRTWSGLGNTSAGIRRLTTQLKRQGAERIVVEATGGYEKRGVAGVVGEGRAMGRADQPASGAELRARRLAKLAKTDGLDARMLAEMAAVFHARFAPARGGRAVAAGTQGLAAAPQAGTTDGHHLHTPANGDVPHGDPRVDEENPGGVAARAGGDRHRIEALTRASLDAGAAFVERVGTDVPGLGLGAPAGTGPAHSTANRQTGRCGLAQSRQRSDPRQAQDLRWPRPDARGALHGHAVGGALGAESACALSATAGSGAKSPKLRWSPACASC